MAERTTWDASAYHDVADVQLQWGLDLLDRHDWKGDEHVLDAGCGTGRLAHKILDRHPGARVVAVDVESGMAEQARRTLEDHKKRVTVLEGDVTALPVDGPFDLVVSNAVLHWVHDHERAYQEFHRVLRPGGHLLASYGGQGNLHGVHETARQVLAEEPFADHSTPVESPWNRQDQRSTLAFLEAAGFRHAHVRLEPVDVTFEDDEQWRRFLQVVTLRTFLRALPQSLHERFLDRYMQRAREQGLERRLDFRRIFVDARRPDG